MDWLRNLIHRRLLALAIPFLLAALGRAGITVPQEALDQVIQAAILFAPAALSLWSFLQPGFQINGVDLRRRLIAGIVPVVIVVLKQLGIVIPGDVLTTVTEQGAIL